MVQMPHTSQSIDTPKPASSRPIPGRIGAVLRALATLINHAGYFAATVKTRIETPEFATAAAVFGTYDLPTILFRLERGLRHALALRDYLLARAARGRNLRFSWPPRVELQPHHRPPAKPAATPSAKSRRPSRPDPALLGPDDPRASYMPTPEEFAAGVRRRPVGRTVNYILMDLALVPGFCGGEFWNDLYKILRRYGGSINRLYQVRERREVTFQRERDRRPETWHIDWRSLHPSNVRLALGCLFGEPPPAIVPS